MDVGYVVEPSHERPRPREVPDRITVFIWGGETLQNVHDYRFAIVNPQNEWKTFRSVQSNTVGKRNTVEGNEPPPAEDRLTGFGCAYPEYWDTKLGEVINRIFQCRILPGSWLLQSQWEGCVDCWVEDTIFKPCNSKDWAEWAKAMDGLLSFRAARLAQDQ